MGLARAEVPSPRTGPAASRRTSPASTPPPAGWSCTARRSRRSATILCPATKSRPRARSPRRSAIRNTPSSSPRGTAPSSSSIPSTATRRPCANTIRCRACASIPKPPPSTAYRTASGCGSRTSADGAAQVAWVTEGMKPGCASAEHGWWFPETEGAEPNLYGVFDSNINNLTSMMVIGETGYGAPTRAFCARSTLAPRRTARSCLPSRSRVGAAGCMTVLRSWLWEVTGMSNNYGLFINYEYCTGCHTCEVACKKALGLPEGSTASCCARTARARTSRARGI